LISSVGFIIESSFVELKKYPYPVQLLAEAGKASAEKVAADVVNNTMLSEASVKVLLPLKVAGLPVAVASTILTKVYSIFEAFPKGVPNEVFNCAKVTVAGVTVLPVATAAA
jgi:hypothetical protein